jgi:hypothetical protein
MAAITTSAAARDSVFLAAASEDKRSRLNGWWKMRLP